MSLETGKIISRVVAAHGKKWAPEFIASTLAFLCGFIVLGLGLLRLGWVVEFIPAPAVSGFMTGSAINIVASQVPGLFGIANLLEYVVPDMLITRSPLPQHPWRNVLSHHQYVEEITFVNA